MNWSLDSGWFDLFVVTGVLLVGNILMNVFEERTPRFRRLVKTIFLVLFFGALSFFFGRWVGLGVLSLTLIPLLIIHGYLLPKKGINGWTGEPKGRYYDFRGWSKDIFTEGVPKK